MNKPSSTIAHFPKGETLGTITPSSSAQRACPMLRSQGRRTINHQSSTINPPSSAQRACPMLRSQGRRTINHQSSPLPSSSRQPLPIMGEVPLYGAERVFLPLPLHLDPYLAQWFIHEQGGSNPVSIQRGSPECDILELYLAKHPGKAEEQEDDDAPNVFITLPRFKHKNTTVCRYLSPTGRQALKHVIRLRFVHQLYMELFTERNFDKQVKTLIWSFMDRHGIDFTDTNWHTIEKIYLRKRSAQGTLFRQKKA